MTTIKCLIILICCVTSVCADIRCYVCNTQTTGTLYSERCGDDFRLIPRDAIECANQGTCVKTRGYRDEGGRRVVEITRGCVPQRSGSDCEDINHNGISVTACYCNTDYCNSSTILKGSTWLFTLLGAVLGFRFINRS